MKSEKNVWESMKIYEDGDELEGSESGWMDELSIYDGTLGFDELTTAKRMCKLENWWRSKLLQRI